VYVKRREYCIVLWYLRYIDVIFTSFCQCFSTNLYSFARIVLIVKVKQTRHVCLLMLLSTCQSLLCPSPTIWCLFLVCSVCFFCVFSELIPVSRVIVTKLVVENGQHCFLSYDFYNSCFANSWTQRLMMWYKWLPALFSFWSNIGYNCKTGTKISE